MRKDRAILLVENQCQAFRRFARSCLSWVMLSWGCGVGLACERPVAALSGTVGEPSESNLVASSLQKRTSQSNPSNFGVESHSMNPLVTASRETTAVLPVGVDPSVVGDTAVSDAEAGNAALQTLPEPTYLAALPPPGNSGSALAERFSSLQPWQCRDELRRRKIAVRVANLPARGVATPLRLVGPVGALRFVTPGQKSVYGILDCRLVLLLSELSSRLSVLSVKEVYVDNFYRPKAHLPGKKVPSQHALGLAVDIAGFGLSDGTVLNIERDFSGNIGAPVCGPDVVLSERTRQTVLLRNIVCELARLHAFNYLLTPNHDTAHRNHLHGDIKRSAREHVVR
jgi:hypothetical protein